MREKNIRKMSIILVLLTLAIVSYFIIILPIRSTGRYYEFGTYMRKNHEKESRYIISQLSSSDDDSKIAEFSFMVLPLSMDEKIKKELQIDDEKFLHKNKEEKIKSINEFISGYKNGK